MSNPKILLLLKSLRGATNAGRIVWTETLRDHFAVRVDAVTIIIAHDSEGGRPLYHVSVHGAQDRLAERETFQEGDEGYALALEIHDELRGRAPAADRLIDNTIARLDLLANK